MKRMVLALILCLAVTCYTNSIRADELTVSLEKQAKISYTGIAPVPDPNVILQGGDTFEDATVIPVMPHFNTGNTCGYVDNYDVMCPYGGQGPDVVYVHTPPYDMEIMVSLCNGSDYDSKLMIYEDFYQNLVACNDDYCTSPNYPYPYVSFIDCVPLTAWHNYYFIVDGYGSECGNYVLEITPCIDWQIDMIPDNTPVEVSPGGQFGFTGSIGNLMNYPIDIDVWIMLQLPGGAMYGPLQTFDNIHLDQGQVINAHMDQYVPVYAPLGTYSYIAYAGYYPDYKGDSSLFEFTVISGPTTGDVDEWELSGGFDLLTDEIPSQYALYSPYPNPFNSTTEIRYELPEQSHVRLEIYNLLGRKVETLVDGENDMGYHTAQWDASAYSSGVYFYKLTVGNKVFTRRMTLLK